MIRILAAYAAIAIAISPVEAQTFGNPRANPACAQVAKRPDGAIAVGAPMVITVPGGSSMRIGAQVLPGPRIIINNNVDIYTVIDRLCFVVTVQPGSAN